MRSPWLAVLLVLLCASDVWAQRRSNVEWNQSVLVHPAGLKFGGVAVSSARTLVEDTLSDSRRAPVLEGAILGFTVGALFGGILAATTHKDRPGGASKGAAVTLSAIVWGFPGALIGAAIASVSRRE